MGEKLCIGHILWADRENLPEPLKGRRVGKLACPLYSRLARRQRIQQHQMLYLHDHKGITVLQKLLV